MDAGVHEGINAVIDALAESKDVIVIEAEVEHTSGWDGFQGPWTKFTHIINASGGRIVIKGEHLGTPGPYVLFGVPKPKEKD